MFKRIFLSCMSVIALAFASVCAMALDILSLAQNQETMQKLDAELAQNVSHKVTDCRKPVSIGSGSGDSPLSFVSMLTAINSRSFTANA